MVSQKLIGFGIVGLLAVIAIAVFGTSGSHPSIPSSVTGDVRAMYEWARSTEGTAILEQIPCYCGCVHEGHKHARHCFWHDDGTFDKHGSRCGTCLDIAMQSKAMADTGMSVSAIRDAIDLQYQSHAALATPTPMPARVLSKLF